MQPNPYGAQQTPLPQGGQVAAPQVTYIQPSAEELAAIQQQKAQAERYADLADQLLNKERPNQSWGNVAAQLIDAWTATRMQKKADESAADYTKRMLEAQRQKDQYDKEQERKAAELKRKQDLEDQKALRTYQNEDWFNRYNARRADAVEDRDLRLANELEAARIAAQQKAAEPTFVQKEQIKHEQKRLGELKQSAAGRRNGLKQAQYFRDLLDKGELSTGSWDSFANKWIPGTWTKNQELNQEFNSFAERAARQALKADGETKPTDADVAGMKKAMFGVGSDEGVNLNLLDQYLTTQLQDENTLRASMGLEPLEFPERPSSKQQQAAPNLPPQNDQGWQLMTDANGNKAYVGPNGEVQEVR